MLAAQSHKQRRQSKSEKVEFVGVRPERVKMHDALAPLLFMILFVLFVYGSLLVATLGVSAWAISAYDLAFLSHLDILGVWLLALSLLGGWLAGVFVLAFIPHFILRCMGRFILADKVRLIIVIFLVHIFAVPFILWRIYRNNNVGLRRKYRQKLKYLARGKKMQERLLERRNAREKQSNLASK